MGFAHPKGFWQLLKMPKLCLWASLSCGFSEPPSEIWWHWSCFGGRTQPWPDIVVPICLFCREVSLDTHASPWLDNHRKSWLHSAEKKDFSKKNFRLSHYFPFSYSLALCLYSAFFSPRTSHLTPPHTVLCLDEQETPNMQPSTLTWLNFFSLFL